MHLLLLLLIPVIIFLCILLISVIMDFTSGDEWWEFPLYMALSVPIFIGSVTLVVLIGFRALSI